MDWNKKKNMDSRDSNFFVSHALLELVCVTGKLLNWIFSHVVEPL